jgi:two-component system, cell cycle sensor histidine kinase and response regulator CckA
MDMTMPRLNGEKALHELRRLNPQVRVILSTGYSTTDVRDRFAGDPYVHFVPKPYSRDELLKHIQAALQ